MDDVIASTGMSSSAVYRYFRSKDEIIEATADEGFSRVRDIFARILDIEPTPDPTQTVATVVGELESRTANPEYDMTRIALQTWAESLRNPPVHDRGRALYGETLDHLTELTSRWRRDGHLPPDAEPRTVAATLFTVMHGLIVMHHLVADLPADELGRGLASLGAALDRGMTRA
jgi:AcrR family transcriptional regulator